jgi:hypothetical protein
MEDFQAAEDAAIRTLRRTSRIMVLGRLINTKLKQFQSAEYSNMREALTNELSSVQKASLMARDVMINETEEWQTYERRVRAEALVQVITDFYPEVIHALKSTDA